MSQQSDVAFHALGRSAAATGHLALYLDTLAPELEQEFRLAAEAALFDKSQKDAALIAYGQYELVRRLQKKLAPHILKHKQSQYTR